MSKCQRCGSMGPHDVVVMTKGVHYAKLVCRECGGHAGWQPKPDSDPTKYRRPKQHTNLVRKYSRGFCEMCLTKEAELPRGQTMEAQHVVEFQDGGEPSRENIWIVCTGCHRLIHWLRTYRSLVEQVSEDLTKWKDE